MYRQRSMVRTLATFAGAAAALVGCSNSDAPAAAPPTTPVDTSTTSVVSVPAPDATLVPAADLSLELPGVDSTIDLTTCKLTIIAEPGTLHFANNSAELPDAGAGRDALNTILDQFASASSVTVAGHTSSEGSPERNQELSEDRAEAVAAAGRERLPGVEFDPSGHGSSSPIAVEDGTEATRSKNRRVELSGQVQREECELR